MIISTIRSIRFFENLLYRSKYYASNLQSLRLFPLTEDGSRRHFLNTPRIIDEGQIDWRIPFNDPRVDDFFRLGCEPAPLGAIRELLDLKQGSEACLSAVLSELNPPLREPWAGDSIRISFIGHACALLERKGVSILTDPFVPSAPIMGGIPRFSFNDLPKRIDYALVTHSHQDHFSLECLLRLRHRIGCLIVPKSAGLLYGDISLKSMAAQLGFRNVIELDALEELEIEGGTIIGAPFLGEHSDLAHGKTGYVLRMGKRQILFAADSDCLDELAYSNLRRALGSIDTVFLGLESVGAPLTFAYGSLLPKKPTREQDQSRRQNGCNAERALGMLRAVGATSVYNYAMGQEPWMRFILGFQLHETSPQWQESETLLATVRRKGFVAAERLVAKTVLRLENDLPAKSISAPVSNHALADFNF